MKVECDKRGKLYRKRGTVTQGGGRQKDKTEFTEEEILRKGVEKTMLERERTKEKKGKTKRWIKQNILFTKFCCNFYLR